MALHPYFILPLCSALFLIIPNDGHTASTKKEMESIFFFEEIDIKDEITPTPILKNKRYSGRIKTKAAYNTQNTDRSIPFSRKNTGPSKLKTSLTLSFKDKINKKLNYKISVNSFYDAYYDVKGNTHFSTEQINTFRSETEFRENYFTLSLTKHFSLTVGRQIIAWGESEASPVIDNINPRDVRELGQTALDETRIPISAIQLSMARDDIEANFVYSFEFRGDKTGVKGSDFDPYISIRDALPIRNPRKPYSFFRGGEQYFRLKKQFKDADIALFLSNSYRTSKILTYNAKQQSLKPVYKRFQLIGLSSNVTTGSWLTRLELAYKRNVAEPRNDLLQQINLNKSIVSSWSEKNIIQTSFGVEYYGSNNMSISVEWMSTIILKHEKNLRNDKLASTYLLFFRRTLLNERAGLNLSWFKFSNENSDIIRANLEYEYQDGLRLSISYIAYETSNKDSFLYNYRNNDRVTSSISYYF